MDDLPVPPALLAAPGYVARRLHQAYVAAWARYVDALLTGPQFAVLTAVDAYPGADQGLLARTVAVDPETIAGIVRRLEDRRLVVCETPLADAGKRLIALTSAGYGVLRATGVKARALDQRLLRDHDDDRVQALLGELTTLTQQWESLVAGS